MSWELIISEVALAVATFAACISVSNFMVRKYDKCDMELAYLKGYADAVSKRKCDRKRAVSK